MSVFKGLSKEFQVGALTSIAITILILGYNFMRGKDNPFKSGTDVYVYYDSAQGLGIGTSVMFNGLRIGQLSSLDITEDGERIQAIFEINSSLEIPKDSKLEIESQILGGQRVRLILGASETFIEDGDTLLGTYAHDQFSAINEQIVPLASKADSLLSSMNAFFNNPGLNKAMNELPKAVLQLELLIANSRALLKANEQMVHVSVSNVANFTEHLNEYHKSVNSILKGLEQSTKGLDKVDIAKSIRRLDSMADNTNAILMKINHGQGSLGKFITSDSLYNALNRGLWELDRVLLDLKKYPEKYVPVPFTKKQRKKAKQESLNDPEVWPK